MSGSLHDAAFAGDAALLRTLLQAGADVDLVDEERSCWSGDDPHYYASGNYRVGMYSALHCAAGGGHAECIRLLLQAGGSVNINAADLRH